MRGAKVLFKKTQLDNQPNHGMRGAKVLFKKKQLDNPPNHGMREQRLRQRQRLGSKILQLEKVKGKFKMCINEKRWACLFTKYRNY